jgi:hypothetical protein
MVRFLEVLLPDIHEYLKYKFKITWNYKAKIYFFDKKKT